jgi:hypothetical protein
MITDSILFLTANKHERSRIGCWKTCWPSLRAESTSEALSGATRRANTALAVCCVHSTVFQQSSHISVIRVIRGKAGILGSKTEMVVGMFSVGFYQL